MKSMETRRVAIFVLRDNNERILLQHRDSNTPRLANYWAFFGGGIEKGETAEQAVKREAMEELQIELTPTFFKKYTHEPNEQGHQGDVKTRQPNAGKKIPYNIPFN